MDPQRKMSILVVCFDGTGNSYRGDTSDTNIVKLYQKFNRTDVNKYHYYQPGIGTYTLGNTSLMSKILGGCKRRLSKLVDLAIGHTFDEHVMAGYRFIMRYYDEGDKIFIFGYSRGAFTARFLARMISTIGVLSKGNEEMILFAYQSYQDYEIGSGYKTAEDHQRYMESFKRTFCRVGAKVYFLGLFDTVNSIRTFENPFRMSKYLPTVLGTADHIRHAVSIDERRLKFKPALLIQDQTRDRNNVEDIKEVFFAGNHGDVGGGWPAPGDRKDADEANDPVQASDLSLEWMITELQKLEPEFDPEKGFFNENVNVFLKNFRGKAEAACTAAIHDSLKFGGGFPASQVIFWNIMEYVPIFKRKELINDQWKSVYFPPNMGDTRDIPSAALHPSVITRMERCENYKPHNLGLEEKSV